MIDWVGRGGEIFSNLILRTPSYSSKFKKTRKVTTPLDSVEQDRTVACINDVHGLYINSSQASRQDKYLKFGVQL